MESENKIKRIDLLNIISKHYPNESVVKIEDFSTGCDNWIYCMTLDTESVINSEPIESTKLIIRFPRKLAEPNCPVMHNPRFQAYVLNILDQNSIPAPKLLHLTDHYLIESYLNEIDLSKAKTNENETKILFKQIGYYVKKFHSIDCCEKFGYIVDIDQNRQKLIGKYDNWLEMFEIELTESMKTCFDNKIIDENEFEKTEQLFSEVKPYLKSYSEPKLLHSDICGNNMRIVLNEGIYEFNGFIDFADCMSGDPMFDLGELLLSYFGDYSVIEMFECGYGLLSSRQKLMIRFYAIYYNMWLLSGSILSNNTHKWKQTLQQLLFGKSFE